MPVLCNFSWWERSEDMSAGDNDTPPKVGLPIEMGEVE